MISDFGLNDAIEAGLVKTPRVVVRDGIVPNSKTMKPKLYHLYREPDVGDDLNRRGAAPNEPLPDLVRHAYTLLGAEWQDTARRWREAGHTIPPVMLTVCNRTETAARIQYYFDNGDAHWAELQAPAKTLRVDSKVLDKADKGETSASDKDYEARLQSIVEAAQLSADVTVDLLMKKKEELLREIIDNVGKPGRAGQRLQNVISVAMLSEGWDAKNVTHIMGLRAFTSQLLCEQVIGRGLRRVGYDTEEVIGPDGQLRTLFRPEYVNVFGVPLSIFQDVDDGAEPPPPPKFSYQVESLISRNHLEIKWPNVVRIETVLKPTLAVDWSKVPPLEIDPSTIPVSVELAEVLGGAEDFSKIQHIDLSKMPEGFRLQTLMFRAAQKAVTAAGAQFTGRKELLMVQLAQLVEQLFISPLIVIPSSFHNEPQRRMVFLAMSIDRIVTHLMTHVSQQNRERLEPIFDEEHPIGSTRDMRTWYTTKPCVPTQKSQISMMVNDSAWEQHAANAFERSALVDSYAKNDHLGFQLHYMWNGAQRRYIPDFLVKLRNGKTLVLEIKGEVSEQSKAKKLAMDTWVEGVNAKGGFGVWCHEVVDDMALVQDSLARHSS